MRLMLILAAVAALVAPTAPAVTTAAPVASAWCSALAAGSPSIDILGDSLSTGDTVSDPAQRWHAMWGSSLRSDGAPGTQVWIGGAIDGSATADYVAGAKYSGHIEFTVNHPDLIVMGWGTNDWAGGATPPPVFRSQYQQIINRVRQLSPASQLVLVHMPWVYNSGLTSTRGDQAPYRDVIKALADLNGAQYVGTEFLFPGDDHLLQATSDRIHLNANGQGYLYAAMRTVSLALCGRG